MTILDTLRLQSSSEDIGNKGFWQALIAEATGTFILVFIGLGSCFYGDALAPPIAFGLAGGLGIWATATISGGNINPAVSLGLLVARQISLIRCLLYWLFQIIGALIAALVIKIFKSDGSGLISKPSSQTSSVQAFICEIFITFVLVFTVMRLCVEKNRSDTERGVAPFAIGLSILVGILAGANISGGSMNPARSIGPAVVYYNYDRLWIYIFAPLLGGILAGLLHQIVFTSELSKEHLVSYFTSPYYGQPIKNQKYEDGKDLEMGSKKKLSKDDENEDETTKLALDN